VLVDGAFRRQSPRMVRKRSELPQRVGRQLRILREERGLTQEAVGERAGYSGKYVSEIERGLRDPALTTLERLVEQGVGCALDELLGGVTGRTEPSAGPRDNRQAKLRRSVQTVTGHILDLPADAASRVVNIIQAVVDLSRRR
jgi:transcriptional regulator with XRE-family HTH domain